MRALSSLLLVTLLVLGGLSACSTPSKDKKKETAPTRDIPDAQGDVSFQSFIGRLRTAVAAHDANVLASMMTPNFGYSLNPDLEGAGVFAYWDEKGLWEELKLVVNSEWAPFNDTMVAPAQIVGSGLSKSFRAGIVRVGGSWKFAYFVNG